MAFDPSSSTQPTHQARNLRRRSADVGGLLLATGNNGQGHGWMGVQTDNIDGEITTRFAELLSEMYTDTMTAVNELGNHFVPTNLANSTRSRLIKSLDEWHFEPHKLSDEEVIACVMLLFEALYRIEGMEEAVGISLSQLWPFIQHLRQIYRYENSYHNFEHAVDVLQASYSYLKSAGMVPSVKILLDSSRTWTSGIEFDSNKSMSCLGPQELFIVYLAAIGHDVGHPGFTNVFMENAQTPLSVIFDGKSALEHMHCHLLLRVMRHHNLGVLLDRAHDGDHNRKLLWRTVLATDMSVHDNFMKQFSSSLTKPESDLLNRQVLICQAILKCADISNPSRPYDVSQHWAGALMEEWSSQASYEQSLHLPPSVQPSNDPLMEAKSQVYFINNFAKPLLELVVKVVPEMMVYLDQCTSNLFKWRQRVTRLEREKSKENSIPRPPPPISPQLPVNDQYLTAFPMTLPRPRGASRSESQLSSSPTTTTTLIIGSISAAEPQTSGQSELSTAIPNPIPSSPNDSSAGQPASGASTGATNGVHLEIRAAARVAIRKKTPMGRKSWCAPSFANANTAAASAASFTSPFTFPAAFFNQPPPGSAQVPGRTANLTIGPVKLRKSNSSSS